MNFVLCPGPLFVMSIRHRKFGKGYVVHRSQGGTLWWVKFGDGQVRKFRADSLCLTLEV